MRGPGRRAARRLAAALPLLLCLAGCGAPAPDTQALWQAAMADAVFSEDGEVEELVSLTPEDPEVIWDEAGERVLLLTWHGADDRYEPGEPMAQAGEILATSAGEMIEWYRANGQGVDDWTLRFAQLLGIPGDTDYDRFTAFWVRPEDVLRRVAEHGKELLLPDQDILNALYGRRILPLDDAVWNYDARGYRNYLLRSAGQRDLDWVMAHTAVLHFCGKAKPWRRGYMHRFGVLYKHYIELTRRTGLYLG